MTGAPTANIAVRFGGRFIVLGGDEFIGTEGMRRCDRKTTVTGGERRRRRCPKAKRRPTGAPLANVIVAFSAR